MRNSLFFSYTKCVECGKVMKRTVSGSHRKKRKRIIRPLYCSFVCVWLTYTEKDREIFHSSTRHKDIMFYSPCSFSSSALTKKFGSDQIGVGPQRLPPSALLHRGWEDHLSSQCVHLLPSLPLHPLLHHISCFPFIIFLSASFFHVFILSSFRLSSCLAV